jgi:hypothetical protein
MQPTQTADAVPATQTTGEVTLLRAELAHTQEMLRDARSITMLELANRLDPGPSAGLPDGLNEVGRIALARDRGLAGNLRMWARQPGVLDKPYAAVGFRTQLLAALADQETHTGLRPLLAAALHVLTQSPALDLVQEPASIYRLSSDAHVVELIATAIRKRERTAEEITSAEHELGYHNAIMGYRDLARDILREIDKTVAALPTAASVEQSHTVPESESEELPLPTLYIDCPSCTDEEATKANHAEWRAWHLSEEKALASYIEAGGSLADWERSPARKELDHSRPNDLEEGCGDCEGTRNQATPAGQQVLDFLHAMGWTSA